jgi:hypothetical protein
MKVTREPTRRFHFPSAVRGSAARAAATRDLVANGALPVDLHLRSLHGAKARVLARLGWNSHGTDGAQPVATFG